MLVLSKGRLVSGPTPVTISSFDEIPSLVTKLLLSTNSDCGSGL